MKAAPKEMQMGITGQSAAIAAGTWSKYCCNRNTWTTNTRYTPIKNSTQTGKISDSA